MISFLVGVSWVFCMLLNYKAVQAFCIAGETTIISPMSWLAFASGPIGVFTFGAVMAIHLKELIVSLKTIEKTMEEYINETGN